MSGSPRRIALLGAESTGKTSLGQALAKALQGRHGLRARLVPELLREWCEREGRTPRPHEQAAIAHEQARRVLAIAEADADVVIADTTPLMTAVYSEHLFADRSLHDFALAHQVHYDLTLVTGLDLPWEPDGLQRDGAHVREPVDRLLRAALDGAALPYKVVYGQGERRLANALQAIGGPLRPPDAAREAAQFAIDGGRRPWRCERCSDADCEHRLFSDLLRR